MMGYSKEAIYFVKNLGEWGRIATIMATTRHRLRSTLTTFKFCEKSYVVSRHVALYLKLRLSLGASCIIYAIPLSSSHL